MGYGFASLHPLSLFLYYLGAIVLIINFYHPIFLLASLLILIAINLIQDGGGTLKSYGRFYLFIGLIILLINPLFSSRGASGLFYIGNKLVTLESFIYGLCTMLSLISIMILFLSYNLIMTNNKFIYLFSHMLPKTSFLIMMATGFIPLFRRRMEEISTIQRLKGGEVVGNSLRDRIAERMKILNTLLIWSLEESVIRARSMRARGYGIKKERSFYFNYRMDKLDILLLISIVFSVLLLLLAWNKGWVHFQIYPKLSNLLIDFKTLVFLTLYSLYMGIPIIIEGMDERKWHK